MAKYRVLRQTLLGDRVYDPGAEIEYDGIPGDNLEPLDAAAKKAAEDAEEHFEAERQERALAANPDAVALGAAVVRRMQGKAASPKPTGPVYNEAEEEHTATRGRSKS